jgi:hypothetical protein
VHGKEIPMRIANDRDYPTAVVDVLVSEFPELSEPATASIVRNARARHTTNPTPSFEVILDSVLLANWRLRAHRERPSRVRLACYRVQQNSVDRVREQRVNDALERISG